eukprot:m.148856 g.148856  ORF g.148856 m.148856 type:complete len:444 (-) comp16145_c1_seq2:2063-3394(-)
MASIASAVFSASPSSPLSVSTVLLCAVNIGISYCDRVNIAVAVVKMAEEFEWDAITKGSVLAAFFYGYVCSQVIGSLLSARFGGRRVLFWATVVWSLATFFTPEAANMGLFPLMVIRICLGLAEGFAFPSIYHIFAESDPHTRSRNIGAVHTGGFAGTILAFYVSEALILHSHWASVFRLFGTMGLGWAFVWAHHVGYHRVMGDGQSSFSRAGLDGLTPSSLTVLNIFQSSTYHLAARLLLHPFVIPIFVGHFCHATSHFVALSWLPTYYHEVSEDASTSKAAVIAGPYACMAVFSLISAYLADRMLIEGANRTTVRRLFGGAGFGIAALLMALFLAVPASWLNVRAFCLTMSLGASAITAAGHEANKLDVSPPELTGFLQGLSNTIAAFGGVIGVPLAARLYDHYHTWASVFGMLGIVYAIGALTAIFFAVAERIPMKDLLS